MDMNFPNEAKLEYGVYVPLVKETPVVWGTRLQAEEYARGHGVPSDEILVRSITAWTKAPVEIGETNRIVHEALAPMWTPTYRRLLAEQDARAAEKAAKKAASRG